MTEILGQLRLLEATARASDPTPSRLAAEKVNRGNADLIKAIRAACWTLGAATAFEIADEVDRKYPGRWASDTIRSACNPKRSGLTEFEGGTTPRGNACCYYALQAEPVATNGRL